MFVELDLPPGVFRRGTERESQGRYYDSDCMRWYEDGMGPIGGWVQRTTTPMTGMARAMIAWRPYDLSLRFLAVGTHSKLYAVSQTATAPTDITPVGFITGRADASAGAGYGIGLYGAGTYGTPRVDNVSIIEASVWTLDTFGQDLYGVMSDDGVIYKWQRNLSVVAAALGGSAPTGNAALVTTPERFLFVLGAGGVSRRVQWADQETDSTWTPTSTNQAGDFDIQGQGACRCGRRLRGVTLIWTDVDVHAATYIGLPYVYRFDRAGENCGAISRGSPVSADTAAYWMSLSGFFKYEGGVVTEIECDVYDKVFGDMNATQRSKINGVLSAAFSEVTWYFPSGSSTEIDRYVTYNYRYNYWTYGSLARLCGVDKGVFANPIRVDSSGYLYDHETGSARGSITPYAESGPLENGDGERITKLRALIPDEKTQGDVTVTFKTKDWPNGSETSWGPYDPANPLNLRIAARQAKMRISGDQATAWRWGKPRLEVVEGGRR